MCECVYECVYMWMVLSRMNFITMFRVFPDRLWIHNNQSSIKQLVGINKYIKTDHDDFTEYVSEL